MSDAQPENRAEWMAQLVARLKPHLKDDQGDQPVGIDAVLVALGAAHSQGMRDAAVFCRHVGTAARRHCEVAKALADGFETLASQADAADAALQQQEGS